MPLRFWVRAERSVMCDRLGLEVLALGPAAVFAVLMILAITTIAGALRPDIHGGSGRRWRRGRVQPPAAVICSSSPARRVRYRSPKRRLNAS